MVSICLLFIYSLPLSVICLLLLSWFVWVKVTRFATLPTVFYILLVCPLIWAKVWCCTGTDSTLGPLDHRLSVAVVRCNSINLSSDDNTVCMMNRWQLNPSLIWICRPVQTSAPSAWLCAGFVFSIAYPSSLPCCPLTTKATKCHLCIRLCQRLIILSLFFMLSIGQYV